jgi:hypothetical protein
MDRTELAVVLITALLMVSMVAFAWVGGIAFRRTTKGGPKSFGLLMARALRTATVILVVYGTVLLALLDKLSRGAVAVLASIASFVLGSEAASRRRPGESPELDDSE